MKQNTLMPRYKIYSTLFDSFHDYLKCSDTWQEFWGNSDDPSKSEEEYESEQFEELIGRINRVPFESEAAEKGTAFNDLVDRAIKDPIQMQSCLDNNQEYISYSHKSRTGTLYDFAFKTSIVKEFADYFTGAISQLRVSAPLQTKYGTVELYGVIDELLPDRCCDIKTTTKYEAFKFKDHFQHLVYPYILNKNGNNINDFEYNILLWNKEGGQTMTENYSFVSERDEPRIVEICEMLIEFLEANKGFITDKKIFNEQED